MNHLQQLQNIANANDGTRAASTSGYNASVDYVVSQLQKHSDLFSVTVQDFNYSSIIIHGATNLTIFSPTQQYDLEYGFGFTVLGGNNGVTNISNITVTIANNYGCEASDYGAVQGTVVLVKRGNCSFVDKAKMAASQLPAAVIIYNEGNTLDRFGLFSAAIGEVSCPVLGTTYYAGQVLVGSSVSFVVDLAVELKFTKNVVADSKFGREDRVVVVGSHLDSVPAGPGINDNGSGSMMNLAIALLLTKDDHHKKVHNKIRFCWFGAEELGLLGSEFYVGFLNRTNPAELAKISVMLNFDMIGSPNFMRGVYNGSSDANSKGSAVVQNLFNAYYEKQKINIIPTEFSGRSDYGPFLAAGIPAGGLFTGAEVEKTMEQRKLFGGLAGASYDPCYHKACDTIDNIDQGVVADMSKGAAHVLETLSSEKELQALLNPQ